MKPYAVSNNELPQRARSPRRAMPRARIAVLLLATSGIAFVVLRAQSHLPSGDLTFNSQTSVCGHPISSDVLMIKQGKFRHEMHIASGRTFIDVYDCPRQRLIKIHEHTRRYMVLKLSPGRPSHSSDDDKEDAATLTRTVDLHDTGERRDFFGFTARHVQGTTTDKGGTGKCARDGSSPVWIDGWDIDPPVEGCYWSTVHEKFRRGYPECSDRVTVKVTGLDSPSYSMLDDVGPPNNKNLAIHNETTSVSRTQLDPSLFEPPAGYQEVRTYQELYGDDLPKTAQSEPQHQ